MAEKMKKKLEEKKIDWRYNLSEYWGALGKYRGMMSVLIFVVVIIELMQLVPKFLFKEVVDKGTLFFFFCLGLEEISFIFLTVGFIYFSSSMIQVISVWCRSHFLARIETRMMADLKIKYFNHIVNLDHGFHTGHKTGSLISRMTRGVSSVERMTDIIVFNFAPLVLQLVFVGASLIYFSLNSAIVVGVITISFIVFGVYMQRIQQGYMIESNIAEDAEKANIGDVFTNIDSIKYFGKESFVSRLFKKFSFNVRDTSFRTWGFYRWMDSGQIIILTIGTIFLLYFPMKEFLAGEISIGTVVFIYTIYGNLTGPMFNFVSGIKGYYRAMADSQDLFNYGKIESVIKNKVGARGLRVADGDIEFRDVDFAYKRKKIFRDFDLKIPAKKKVAFVGHSGCGKSTLVNLLYRFYDVQKGAVMIDGEDVRDFKQESLRGEMSIVPQECVLFDDTIWNNIKFSNPRAKRDEVWRAIRFAQLNKVITEMPEKERTIVGERGVKLSGGEKQRVSIARALLADKKILVLDEATSALDSETEFEIQKSLAELMRGRTSIIIAHRLSTIMHADKIVVMKKGRIVEMGEHDELLAKRGEYCRLWKLQKGGYIK